MLVKWSRNGVCYPYPNPYPDYPVPSGELNKVTAKSGQQTPFLAVQNQDGRYTLQDRLACFLALASNNGTIFRGTVVEVLSIAKNGFFFFFFFNLLAAFLQLMCGLVCVKEMFDI